MTASFGVFSIPLRVRRAAVLVGGCVVVGCGVGLVLRARLGSDGYSTAIYGLSDWARLPYAVANWGVGLGCVLCAYLRGVRPGVATIVHPLVVGGTVDLVLRGTPTTALPARIMLLMSGTLVLSAGVALYLSASWGSGPFESVAFALAPVPFRAAYIILQAAGTCLGWVLDAPVGPGTLLIVFAVGPLVAIIRHRLPSPRPGCPRS